MVVISASDIYCSFLLHFLEIDECETTPCDMNANCTNTPGSYSCDCNGGYSGNGTSCSSKPQHFELFFYGDTSLKSVFLENWTPAALICTDFTVCIVIPEIIHLMVSLQTRYWPFVSLQILMNALLAITRVTPMPTALIQRAAMSAVARLASLEMASTVQVSIT